jgi:hypothetical protein
MVTPIKPPQSPRTTLLLPYSPSRQPDSGSYEESMRVMFRVRPLLFHELETEKVCTADSDMSTVRIFDQRSRHDMLAQYDIVIDENGT